MMELLKDKEITGRETRIPVKPRAARGVGHVEAPRGTLIHDYETDANGMITNCNLIVGTTHNNAAINMSVTQAAKALIKGGNYNEQLLNTVEMSIRAYDPCYSCATHALGQMPLEVAIVGADGTVSATPAIRSFETPGSDHNDWHARHTASQNTCGYCSASPGASEK